MAVNNSLKNMVLCLLGITVVCAALLGWIYSITKEPIARAEQEKNTRAIAQVCPPFASLEEKNDAAGEYILAFSDEGDMVAYVIKSSASGFGGAVNLMVGFRPDGSIYNTVVLSHSETPGLGAKCADSTFSKQFKGFNPFEKTLSVRQDGGDVDAITASTITSRAYCKALENAVTIFKSVSGIVPGMDEMEISWDDSLDVAVADTLLAGNNMVKETCYE